MGIEVRYRRMSEQKLKVLESDPQLALTTLFKLPGINSEAMLELITNPQGMQERAAEIRETIQTVQADTTYLVLDGGSKPPIQNPPDICHTDTLNFELCTLNFRPAVLDLGKDWHALHYLLTGDTSMEPSHNLDAPLHNIVMGGNPTLIESSYGWVRCLLQVDILDIVAALTEITTEELRERFSTDDFNSHEIYPNPQPSGWTRDEVENVFILFPRLKKLFELALEANEIVLVGHY
ncbi:MAG: DUF1877 family protein [Spirulina sp. SIO3F2]|nr:DUF1877 family protein [Spirulina sp. SIO3F2]